MQYKLNKGFIVQKLDQNVTIFDGEESVLYSFNETASFIFQRIKMGWEKKRILEAMVAKYNVESNQAQKDFNDFINNLLAKRVIVHKKE